MYQQILDRLCCPQCRADFSLTVHAAEDDDVTEGVLSCANGHCFRIHAGVADFNSKEQEWGNNWETMGQDQTFEEVDQQIEATMPGELLRRRNLVIDAVADAAVAKNGRLVLDIASGRGLLLTELVKRLPEDAHLIAIDLSAFVLGYDRQKFLRLAPGRKVSYLACDATCLPLKDGSMDVATTFAGISNMIGCADDALRDAHRVLKPGGSLIDSYLVIRKDSKGYELLHQFCAEQGVADAEAFFLESGVTEHHEALFAAVECRTVCEGIGESFEGDLLPYGGEWYADQVFVSEK